MVNQKLVLNWQEMEVSNTLECNTEVNVGPVTQEVNMERDQIRSVTWPVDTTIAENVVQDGETVFSNYHSQRRVTNQSMVKVKKDVTKMVVTETFPTYLELDMVIQKFASS